MVVIYSDFSFHLCLCLMRSSCLFPVGVFFFGVCVYFVSLIMQSSCVLCVCYVFGVRISFFLSVMCSDFISLASVCDRWVCFSFESKFVSPLHPCVHYAEFVPRLFLCFILSLCLLSFCVISGTCILCIYVLCLHCVFNFL